MGRRASVAAAAVLAVGVAGPARGSTVTGPFGFQPGNIYAVIQGGIAEYGPTLTPIAAVQIPNVSVTEGAAFTPDGNLVFSAFETVAGVGTDHVVGINSAGSVVRDRDLGIGELDRASEGVVDKAGYIYEASPSGLLRISPDLSTVTPLPYAFSRASGVTIGPNGLLYATDQAAAKLVTFSASLAAQTVVSTKATPTGLAFDGAGRLLVGEYNFGLGRLDQIDPTTGAETLVSSSNDPSDVIAAAADGSYYLSFIDGHEIEHVSAGDVVLQTVGTGGFSDSIAVNVPEPATAGVLAVAAAGLLGHRRRYRA